MLVARMILGGSLAVMPGLAVAAALPDPAAIHVAEPLHRSALPGPQTLTSTPDLRPQPRPDAVLAVAAKGPDRLRPKARDPFLPKARWDGQRGTGLWTRGLLAALRGPAAGLTEVVPRDIDTWCPAYASNPPRLRRAFWVGVMSALAQHESRQRPGAVGGGGLYFGLLQILPGTARGHGCLAQGGDSLRDPVGNLSCAARIMARTVTRDRAVALNDGRWRGIAADWGPMTKPSMRNEMAAWTSRQSYCQKGPVVSAPRPPARPAGLSEAWPETDGSAS